MQCKPEGGVGRRLRKSQPRIHDCPQDGQLRPPSGYCDIRLQRLWTLSGPNTKPGFSFSRRQLKRQCGEFEAALGQVSQAAKRDCMEKHAAYDRVSSQPRQPPRLERPGLVGAGVEVPGIPLRAERERLPAQVLQLPLQPPLVPPRLRPLRVPRQQPPRGRLCQPLRDLRRLRRLRLPHRNQPGLQSPAKSREEWDWRCGSGVGRTVGSCGTSSSPGTPAATTPSAWSTGAITMRPHPPSSPSSPDLINTSPNLGSSRIPIQRVYKIPPCRHAIFGTFVDLADGKYGLWTAGMGIRPLTSARFLPSPNFAFSQQHNWSVQLCALLSNILWDMGWEADLSATAAVEETQL